MALCVGRLCPGELQRPGLEAVGPVCVFSIMKVNQKENVQFQGVSQSALVREYFSASCFIYSDRWPAMAQMLFNHADFQSLY